MLDTMVNFLLCILGMSILYKYEHKLRQTWFAFFMTKIMIMCNKYTTPMKKELFKPLRDIVSFDPKLRAKKAIRVLEIGAGSALAWGSNHFVMSIGVWFLDGANLQHYPPGTHLILEDVNPKFESRLKERLDQHPELVVERFLLAPAEHMDEVADASVDVVISTQVFCSVTDIPATLAEVRRVLVPGGKFFFFEHVEGEKWSLVYFAQHFLMITRIWPVLFCGCSVVRNIAKYFKEAPFTTMKIHPYELSLKDNPFFIIVKSQIYGIATK